LTSKVDKIAIPDEYNVIAEYPMGILRESKYPVQSQKFMSLVMSDEGKAVLEKYGFAPVEVAAAKIAGTAMAAAAA
jgi:molybdate transport system substrate-binding protein